MRIRYLPLVVLLGLSPWHSYATTLEQAMDMAATSHPQLNMSQLDIEAAKGQLKEQSAYAYNPEISLASQNRKLNGGGNSDDYYITLSHGIELGGKQGYRQAVAQAGVDASKENAESMRQRVAIGVAQAFVGLYFANNELDVRAQQSDLLKNLSVAMQRQLEVGDANILERNLANAAYASSLRATTDAQQAYTLAQATYFTAIARFDEEKGVLDLPKLNLAWSLPEDPVAVALASRSDVAVMQAKLRQFDAKVALADAQRMPDVTLSLMRGQEAGEDLTTLGVSFPIPFWNTHTGAYRSAVVEATRTEREAQWFTRKLKLEVQTAVYNHRSAMQALHAIGLTQLNQTSLSNVELAQLAYKAGELSLEDLVIHMNQALDAKLTALSIIKQAWLARIRLAQVLGHPEYILEGVQL